MNRLERQHAANQRLMDFRDGKIPLPTEPKARKTVLLAAVREMFEADAVKPTISERRAALEARQDEAHDHFQRKLVELQGECSHPMDSIRRIGPLFYMCDDCHKCINGEG